MSGVFIFEVLRTRECELQKVVWGEPKMVTAVDVTLGQGACPGGGVTLETDNCHVGRDTASNPTTKLGRDGQPPVKLVEER